MAEKKQIDVMLDITNNSLFKKISAVAEQTGADAYVVGGYVRDQFLGKDCKDVDIVVVGDGPAFARAVANALGGANLTIYRRFGTAMLRHQDYIVEFVGARKESYRGDSRNPDVESADLITDMSRRDFTVNAMAVALHPKHVGEFVDPFNGKRDLKKGIIRTPLQPEQTFYDDPLRIMRAVRFATQLQFRIDARTFKGLKTEAHRLKIISQERTTDELNKILLSAKPSVGFDIMDETGILQVILPEIHALRGVDQIGAHRHKDVLQHTLKVLDNIAPKTGDLRLRYAALFHDVAKPRTKSYNPDVGWTFHGHEEIGARMFKRIGKRLKLSNDTVQFVEKMIRLHLRPIHLSEKGVTDSAIRRLIFTAGDDIDDLITLCRADITSGNPQRVKRHLANFDHVVQRVEEVEEKDRLRNFQPPVRGDEIMRVCGLKPGPKVGIIKNAIEEAILNGDIPNEHDAAFEYMLKIKDDILSQPPR